MWHIGQNLFKQGSPATSFCIVLEGMLTTETEVDMPTPAPHGPGRPTVPLAADSSAAASVATADTTHLAGPATSTASDASQTAAALAQPQSNSDPNHVAHCTYFQTGDLAGLVH